MKIIVMGTGPFAVPTCERLISDGHEIPLCVTRPVVNPLAKKQPPRPVYDWARRADVDVFEPASVNSPEAISKLAEVAADLYFVCDYGQILSSSCLAASRLGGINLHGSLLPRHRGAAPVQWALLRGDPVSGVTVIHMSPKLDAGPALAVASTPISEDESAAELEPRLAQLGVDATVQALAMLNDWDSQSQLGTRQDPTLVTRAPRFSKSDGQLDFRLTAEYLVRLVRACQPWPGTFAELAWPEEKKKIRVIVRSARSIDGHQLPSEMDALDIAQTVAISTDQLGVDWPKPWNKLLAVKTGAGVFLIGVLQPAGKRAMPAEEFLRGHPLEPGCKFILPAEPLQDMTVGS